MGLSCDLMQVTITTPTSSATGYYLLPYDDASKATFTIEPEEVASISLVPRP